MPRTRRMPTQPVASNLYAIMRDGGFELFETLRLASKRATILSHQGETVFVVKILRAN